MLLHIIVYMRACFISTLLHLTNIPTRSIQVTTQQQHKSMSQHDTYGLVLNFVLFCRKPSGSVYVGTTKHGIKAEISKHKRNCHLGQ